MRTLNQTELEQVSGGSRGTDLAQMAAIAWASGVVGAGVGGTVGSIVGPGVGTVAGSAAGFLIGVLAGAGAVIARHYM